MTSQKVIAANRRNAGRSTGPRTIAGKRKIAANRWRHGLTIAVSKDAQMSETAARIAAALAGPGASPQHRALTYPIAEAHADVLRARAARATLIDRAAARMAAQGEGEAEAIVETLPSLVRLDRYERRATARRSRALRALRKFFTLKRK